MQVHYILNIGKVALKN